MIKFCLRKILRSFSMVFYILPIKNNRILFSCHAGKVYNCSPKIVLEFLLPQNRYDIVLVINKPNKFKLPKKIKTCSYFSLLHLYYFFTSRICLHNSGNLTFLKRKGQVIINTWHGGGAYKRTDPRDQSGNIEDFFLSSSKLFTELFLQNTCKFPNEILQTGMPRNDIFFYKEKVSKANIKVREHFNIPKDSMLVLYAPTWRESKKNDLYGIDIPKIKTIFEKRFGKQVAFAIRMHHYNAIENLNSGEALDFGAYPDMQELLCASDAVITDYSSLQWDFCHLKRPGFLYCTDIEEYIIERSGTFLTPIETWGFSLAKNNDELEKNILEYNEQKALEKIQSHLNFLGNCEDGHATEKVCSLIEKICFEEKK